MNKIVFNPNDFRQLEVWVGGEQISVNEIDIHIDNQRVTCTVKMPITLDGTFVIPETNYQFVQCCPLCTAEITGEFDKEEKN